MGNILFYTSPVGDGELLLAVTEFWTVILHQICSENHTSNNWPNHRRSGFPDLSVLGPSVMLRWRIPPGFMPVLPGWRRALPIWEISCILLALELSQSRRCLFEISSMPYVHRVGTHHADPPVVSIHSNFIWSDVVRVVFVRQFVHFTTYFFTATQFNHILAALFITDEPVVNTQEIFFLHFFLSEFAMKYSWSPASSRNGARGVALSCSNWESRGDRECAWRIACAPPFPLARSARTCSGQCRSPSTTGIFSTVL